MKRDYGMLPEGGSATVYTLKNGALKAEVMDYGATLVSLWVPGKDGIADVVLGYDKAWDYAVNNSNLGATVGRNANRVGGASFLLNGQKVQLGDVIQVKLTYRTSILGFGEAIFPVTINASASGISQVYWK